MSLTPKLTTPQTNPSMLPESPGPHRQLQQVSLLPLPQKTPKSCLNCSELGPGVKGSVSCPLSSTSHLATEPGLPQGIE